jgi:hypothetical protein
MIRSRAGRFRVRRSGSSLHHWHRGPGPTTELSSQTVADLEPDGPIFESDGAGANKPHTLRTWSGAGPTTELSSQNVDVRSRAGRQVRVGRSGSPARCGPGPEPGLTLIRIPRACQRRARDANARTAVRREATSKDPGLRSCLT